MTQLFSSQQCNPPEHSVPLPYELCLPSHHIITDEIKRALESLKNENIQFVYISTDYDNRTLWEEMHKHLPHVTLITPTVVISNSGKVTQHNQPKIMIDIYLLSSARHFIANCVSSFSAFVSRIRTYNNHYKGSTSYLAFNTLHQFNNLRDEL